jgi:drug/metabolite transporter (DMT)-like permease
MNDVIQFYRQQIAAILNHPSSGVAFALLSTGLTGWAPIFGKMAYHAGVDPFTLVALRTTLAAAGLWLFYLARWRSMIAIDWRNLIGCLSMGFVNGIGSLFYYTGLQRIDASLVGFLWAVYPIWVFILLSASGQDISRVAVVRLAVAIAGLVMLTKGGVGQPDSLGVMLLLASGAAYGWHLVLGQWVLADVQARTVTLYVLTSMAVTVGVARVLGGQPIKPISLAGWQAIALLGLVTLLSRLFMFAGLRKLGGIQTALIGLGELFVTLLVAYVVLGERLSLWQWAGGGLVILSMFLISRESELGKASPDTPA